MNGLYTPRFAGCRVLVTGGTRGIGKAIATAFAAEGARVVVTARSVPQSEETTEIPEGGIAQITWDIMDVAGIQGMLEQINRRLGGLDMVVNNAGVVRLPEQATDKSPFAEWDYILDINLKAAYFVCQQAAEIMAGHGGGSIVNIASDAGLRPAADPYSISKWGVVGFTAGLAKRYAARGVRINAVAPGPVATQMMNCADGQPKESAGLPLGRYSLPEEIAEVVLFLSSSSARAVFGQTMIINSAN